MRQDTTLKTVHICSTERQVTLARRNLLNLLFFIRLKVLLYLNDSDESDLSELIDRKCASYLFCYRLQIAMKLNFVYKL